jgi:hypothetical protein
MLYHGCVLEDEDTVESVGLEPSATVHVVKPPVRAPEKPKPQVPPVDTKRLSQLIFALQSAMVYPRFHRNQIGAMVRGEKLESIIAATPGLADDRIAIALIRDPLFLLAMTEMEALKVSCFSSFTRPELSQIWMG